MRVNIYAEEMTDRIEIIEKVIDGHSFTALRFYLELPVTVPVKGAWIDGEPPDQVRGPFIHRPGDDDSAAVTFWGKQDLRLMLRKALTLLDQHYGALSEGVAVALVRKSAISTCMEAIGNLRQSEAGLFDAAHSGQRGEDRSNALYDAYQLLSKLAAEPSTS